MQNTQGTAIIRDRGQLTIPEKIRSVLNWTAPNSVVSLVTTSRDEIVIKPYHRSKQVNWDKIWAGIKRVRSFKGKKGNLSKFIAEDRESH